MRMRVPLLGETALVSRAALDLDTTDARGVRGALGVRHLAVNAETMADGRAMAQAGFHAVGRARQIAELPLLPSVGAMAARLQGKWRNR